MYEGEGKMLRETWESVSGEEKGEREEGYVQVFEVSIWSYADEHLDLCGQTQS